MTDYTSVLSGDWDNILTWGAANYPQTGDTATIAPTHVVSVKGTQVCGNVTVNDGGILRFNGQVNTVPAILNLDDGAILNVESADSGIVDQTGTGSTGYASVTSAGMVTWVDNPPTLGAGYWKFGHINFQVEITTGGAGCTFEFTGNCTVDAITITAGDTLKCVTQDTTITCNSVKDITIAGTIISTGATSHNVIWSGYKSFSITNTTAIQTMSYSTLTGLNATTAWNNGPDISIGTGAKLQCDTCTNTSAKVGMQGTSGWFVSKNAPDTVGMYQIYGALSSEDPESGYKGSQCTGFLIPLQANVYGVSFATVYTLGANCTAGTGVIVMAGTTLNMATYNITGSDVSVIRGTLTPGTGTFTSAGTVTIENGGIMGGNTAWTFDCNGSLTIDAGGTLSAPNASGAFTFSGATFAPTGTFTHNSGTMTFDRAGTTTLGAAFITANSIVLNSGTTLNTSAAGNYALAAAGTTNITGTLTLNTSTFTNNGVVTVNTGGTFGSNTAWTGTINAGITNSGGTINLGTGTKTIAASVTIANTTGTLNVNGGVINGTSAATTILTNGGTWNWATCSIKLCDLRFDVTTGGSNSITFTGNMTVDAITVDGILACSTGDTTITCNSAKDIIVTGIISSDGTPGHNVVWTGYKSWTIANVTPFKMTYTTFTGINATTAWNNGTDISIGTGAGVMLGICTLTNSLVGMQATSGWLVNKDASSNFTVYGIVGSETTAPGYYAANVTGSFTLKNADVYGTSFNSSYTLGAAMPNVQAMTINADTTFNAQTAHTLTSAGTVTVAGTMTMTASAHDCNGALTISAGGTYSAPNASYSFNLSGNPTITGTFTHNSGTVTIDGTVTLQTNWTSLNNMNITSNLDTKSGSNFALTTAGTLTNSGTFTGRNSIVTLNALNNSGTFTAPQSTGYVTTTGDVTNSGTYAGGTLSNLNLGGNFDCTSGSITGKLIIVKATGYTLTAPTINGTGVETINATISGTVTMTAGFLLIKNYGTTSGDFRAWGTQNWNTATVYVLTSSATLALGIDLSIKSGTFTFNTDNVGIRSLTVDSGAIIRVTDNIDVYTISFVNNGTWSHAAGYGGNIHLHGSPYEVTPIDALQVMDEAIDAMQVID